MIHVSKSFPSLKIFLIFKKIKVLCMLKTGLLIQMLKLLNESMNQ